MKRNEEFVAKWNRDRKVMSAKHLRKTALVLK
jgi:hypothetical protein